MSRVMTSLRKAILVITNNSLEFSIRQNLEQSNRNLVDHEHFGSGSSNFQRTWLSLAGGDNSSHDYVHPNLMEGNKQLAPLDHHENFGKFSYADEGTHMDQVPAQTGNVLPTSNFSSYYGSDVPQPFNVSKDSASNTCLTWNTLDSSTDNRLMLHFLGHTSPNKDNIQLCEQTSAELNNNSGIDTQYLPAYTRIHWTPEEDELLKELVNQHGEGKWALLAKHFPTRNGKQLRERWKNHCRPISDPTAQLGSMEQRNLMVLILLAPVLCKKLRTYDKSQVCMPISNKTNWRMSREFEG